MSIKELLFSFQGRVGRKVFWVWNVIYIFGLSGMNHSLSALFPQFGALIGAAVALLLLIPHLAVTAKRWHDRDKSTWYLLLFLPVVLNLLVIPPFEPGVVIELSLFQKMVIATSTLSFIWVYIECGFLKGTKGINQYGPEPK